MRSFATPQLGHYHFKGYGSTYISTTMKSLPVLACLLLASSLHGQDTLTIGQIFDLDINDEFHSHRTYPPGPPHVTRMKIIGKSFSADSDTVFYIRAFNNYYTVANPPVLEHHFVVDTNSVYYTNLDSIVMCTAGDSSCTLDLGQTICGVPTVEIGYSSGKFYTGSGYGKGLGLIREYAVDMGSGGSASELFYFKKDTMECGVPDLTTSIGSHSWSSAMAEISPNPFTDHVDLRIASDWLPCKITVIDARGATVFRTTVEQHRNIALNNMMAKGVYIIKIEASNRTGFTRAVKL